MSAVIIDKGAMWLSVEELSWSSYTRSGGNHGLCWFIRSLTSRGR